MDPESGIYQLQAMLISDHSHSSHWLILPEYEARSGRRRLLHKMGRWGDSPKGANRRWWERPFQRERIMMARLFIAFHIIERSRLVKFIVVVWVDGWMGQGSPLVYPPEWGGWDQFPTPQNDAGFIDRLQGYRMIIIIEVDNQKG
jgi:hypothetical protein